MSGFCLFSGGISGSRCQERPWLQPTPNVVQPPESVPSHSTFTPGHGTSVKVQVTMMYGWYMILHQFLDNSDSPSIVEQ